MSSTNRHFEQSWDEKNNKEPLRKRRRINPQPKLRFREYYCFTDAETACQSLPDKELLDMHDEYKEQQVSGVSKQHLQQKERKLNLVYERSSDDKDTLSQTEYKIFGAYRKDRIFYDHFNIFDAVRKDDDDTSEDLLREITTRYDFQLNKMMKKAVTDDLRDLSQRGMIGSLIHTAFGRLSIQRVFEYCDRVKEEADPNASIISSIITMSNETKIWFIERNWMFFDHKQVATIALFKDLMDLEYGFGQHE